MAFNKGKALQNAQKYVLQGKYEQAIEEYKKIIQDNPKDWNTFIQIGNLYLKIGKNAEAISYLRKVADFYIKDGIYMKAIALLKQINRIDPTLEDTALKLADLYIKQGLIMEAKSQLILLGEHFNKKGQASQAAEVFKKLIELEPDNIKAKIELAKTYKILGDFEAAKKEFMSISEEYEKQNLLAESLKILEAALELEPSNSFLLNKIISLYNKIGASEKAIELLEKQIKEGIRSAEVYYLLSEAYQKQNKIKETETLLKKAIEIDPFYNPVNQAYLNLLVSKNDIGAATEFVDNLSIKFIQKRESEKAIPFLRKILEVSPSNFNIADRLAEIYKNLHQENNAISVLNSCLESLLENKEYQSAKELLNKLIAMEPDNEQYKKKLELIQSALAPKIEHISEEQERKEEAEEIKGEVSNEEEIEIEINAAETPSIEVISEASEPLSASYSSLGEETDASISSLEEIQEVPSEELSEIEYEEMKEFIREHLIEAEVFNKYGLIEKAIEQLNLVINRYPLAEEAYLKLKDIYLEKNKKDKAASVFLKLATIYNSQGNVDKANDYIENAFKIDPSNPELLAFKSATQKPSDSFQEVQQLEVMYGVKKPKIEKETKAEFESLDDMELEIDITRDIEDIDSIKEIMQNTVPEESSIETIEEDLSSKEVSAIEEEIKTEEDINEEPHEMKLEEFEIQIPEGSVEAFDNEIAELHPKEESAEEEIMLSPTISEEIIETINNNIRAGKLEEAEEIIEEARGLHGDNPILLEKLQEISQLKLMEEEQSKEEPAKDFTELQESVETAFDEFLPSKEESQDEEIEIELIEEKTVDSIKPEENIEENQEEQIDFALGITEEELEKGLADNISSIKTEEEKIKETKEEEVEIRIEEQIKPIEKETDQGEASSTEEMEGLSFNVSPEEDQAISIIEEEEVNELQEKESEKIEEETSAELFKEEEDFFDLATELEKEMLSVQTAVESEEKPSEVQLSLEEVFNEFKKGVEKQIDSQDYETRYNLGIAYKEMGLLDEAIAEFQIAAKDPKKFIESCSLLGVCFVEKGLPKLAIKWYEKGLTTPGYSEEEYQSLRYDLAQTYELLGEWQKAYEIYLEVYSINSNYRNVAQKIKELETVIAGK